VSIRLQDRKSTVQKKANIGRAKAPTSSSYPRNSGTPWMPYISKLKYWALRAFSKFIDLSRLELSAFPLANLTFTKQTTPIFA
jgi:hypothetical protein